MARGHSLKNCDDYVLHLRPNFYLLFALALNKLRPILNVMPSNTGSFPPKLYFHDKFLIMKGARAGLRTCHRIV